MTTLTIRRGRALRRLVRHDLEMVVAMVAGMMVLDPRGIGAAQPSRLGRAACPPPVTQTPMFKFVRWEQ
jgi:hypothetical protein